MKRIDERWVLIDSESVTVGAVREDGRPALGAVHNEDPVPPADFHGVVLVSTDLHDQLRVIPRLLRRAGGPAACGN